MTATWSFVSTMHGLPETVLPCIAHHLQSDAAMLHIYLDAPNPVVEAALANHPRCVVTVCDADYWTWRQQGRPDKIVVRQLANLRHARRMSTSDWLVHVDSDEFLHPAAPGAALQLGPLLGAVPPEHDWVRFVPHERVVIRGQTPATIFDGVFRSPTENDDLINAAYGDGAKYLWRGLTGHNRGKIGFRRGTQHIPRLHFLARKSDDQTPSRLADAPPFTTLSEIPLLHFEGWSPLHWTSKMARMAMKGRIKGLNPGRSSCLRYLQKAAGQDLLWLHENCQSIASDKIGILEDAGMMHRFPVRIAETTKATFPGLDLSFNPAELEKKMSLSLGDIASMSRGAALPPA